VAKNKLAWLRYRHIVPTSQVWDAIEDSDFEAFDLRPKLITDFCGYNCYTGGDSGSLSRDFYWVPDLTISCEVETSDLGTNPELVFEVTRGVRKFRCRFNLETGVASIVRVIDISRDEEEEVMATAKTKVKGARSVRIRFANVDQRLCLWVNGTLVDFGSGAEYHLPQTFNRSPQDADLTPIGIAAQNATVKVSHLLIERDIYYRSEQLDAVSGTYKFECDQETRRRGSDDDHYARLQRSPARWWEMYASCQNTAEFELGEDEFLMLGDNSPRSKDSRLWSNERKAVHRHAVPRSALVGKAFFIYWPHGIPFFNDGNGFSLKEHSRYANDPKLEKSYPEYRIPFYPHFSRMRRIR
jgi:signal peptidase I